MLQLESALLSVKAAYAGEETLMQQQKLQIERQGKHLQQQKHKISNLQQALKDQEEKARRALGLIAAAAADAPQQPGKQHQQLDLAAVWAAALGEQRPSSRGRDAYQGGDADEGGKGVGHKQGGQEKGPSQQQQQLQMYGWPPAAVEEVVRLQSTVAAAKNDRVRQMGPFAGEAPSEGPFHGAETWQGTDIGRICSAMSAQFPI